MSKVISLAERRARVQAEEHARALVVFECAASLARQAHPRLLALIEEAYGPGFLERQVQASLEPVRRTEAPQHRRPRSKRAP